MCKPLAARSANFDDGNFKMTFGRQHFQNRQEIEVAIRDVHRDSAVGKRTLKQTACCGHLHAGTPKVCWRKQEPL